MPITFFRVMEINERKLSLNWRPGPNISNKVDSALWHLRTRGDLIQRIGQVFDPRGLHYYFCLPYFTHAALVDQRHLPNGQLY